MMRYLNISVVLALLVCCTLSFAGVSKKRFDMGTPSKATVETVADSSQAVAAPAVVPVDAEKSLWVKFVGAQKALRERVTEKVTEMKSGNWGVLWAFFAICFIYGMLHALGPGHGKSIVVGYFLARRGRIRHGIALGAGITFTHTLSAVLLLLILYAILKAAVFPTFEIGRGGIEKASYILVMLTGVLIAGIGLRDAFVSKRHGEHFEPGKASWKELIGVAAITGIVPCPAVALIVLFCLLNSMIGMALLAALFICLGMMLTNVCFGLLAVMMRKGIDKGASKSGRWTATIHIFASVVGGTVVFLAGLMMLLNTFAGSIN